MLLWRIKSLDLALFSKEVVETMREISLHLLCLRLLCVILVSSLGQSATSPVNANRVCGRLIDERGDAISGGSIVIIPDGFVAADSLIVYHVTDEHGQFCIDLPDCSESCGATMYALGPYSPYAETPLRPPFFGLITRNQIFSGRRLNLRDNKGVWVGDVSLQVNYGELSIKMLDQNGRPLLTVGDGPRAAPTIYLRIRDRRGSVVAEEGVSPSAIDSKESTILIALPVGTWGIEVANKLPSATWHQVASSIKIRPGPPSSMRWSLPKTGWDSRNPLSFSHCNQARNEQARNEKELREMGLDLTPGSLVAEAALGNVRSVQLLVCAGLSVNSQGPKGSTALIAASRGGFAEIVGFLLDFGAKVDLTDDQGATALMVAAGNSDGDIVKLLVDYGANVNKRTHNGLSALILAAANGNLEAAEILIRAGADVNARTADHQTALGFAIQSNRTSIITLLKRAGATM